MWGRVEAARQLHALAEFAFRLQTLGESRVSPCFAFRHLQQYERTLMDPPTQTIVTQIMIVLQLFTYTVFEVANIHVSLRDATEALCTVCQTLM